MIKEAKLVSIEKSKKGLFKILIFFNKHIKQLKDWWKEKID